MKSQPCNGMSRLRRASITAALCLLFGAGQAQAITEAQALAAQLRSAAPAINPQVLILALSAMNCAVHHGAEPASRLAVVDYSLPSSQTRLWIFDLASRTLVLQDLVAHGQGSGDNYASAFSNTEGSHQSSLGLFRTQESYVGKHGYSLRLDGLEPGINDQARSRAIVVHEADYVDESWVARHGRIGRSQGCPAVRPGVGAIVVDSLKDGQFMFAYYPDQNWLATSAWLNCPGSTARELLALVD